jgi:hypothetical protein
MLNRPFKWKFPKMVVPQNDPICFNRSFHEINFKKTIHLLGDLHFKNPQIINCPTHLAALEVAPKDGGAGHGPSRQLLTLCRQAAAL